MKEQFTFEVATSDHDLTKIENVINTAYGKVKYVPDGTLRVTTNEILDYINSSQKKLYLLTTPNRDICGTILLDVFSYNKAEIAMFAIHPAYREYKLGPTFMNYVEEAAFKKVEIIILKVIPLFQENLIKFYEHLGYQVSDEIIAIPEEEKVRFIRPECRDHVFFSILKKRRVLKPIISKGGFS